MILLEKISQFKEKNIGLIDLRSAEEFIQGHLQGSCSLPWARLPESMHELPASHSPVVLMGHVQQINQAKQFLQSKGYQVIEHFVTDEPFWKQLAEYKLQAKGCHSVPLWRANPLLSEIIKQVEQQVSGRTAIDLACGAGRDSVYLAQRGWQVTSIDNKADALERCAQLAATSQVEITRLQRDLENQSHPLAGLKADLVLVMRYLHRPLFPDIDKLIKPGGAIIYSTFMQGCEKFGSPRNPAYLLAPEELAEIFSNYRIIIDQQRSLADGRPVALFAAIKNRS